MEKIEIVIRFTTDHGKTYEQTVFKWFEKTHLERKVLHYPGLEIHLSHRRVIKDGHEIHLSRYEYGVLSLLARHPGKLFTKEQIFEAVWHKDSDSYLRAVSSTIGRIRQKIEDDKDHPRYIGLIVPNVVAMYKGDKIRGTLVDTALFGALFVLVCDMIGRVIIFPYELPIELIVGILGSLIFIGLLFYRLKYGRKAIRLGSAGTSCCSAMPNLKD